jgi:hypothetical protein
MEGVGSALVLVVAVAALVVAVLALAMVLARERRDPGPRGVTARSNELERRLAQLSRRLEVVESEVDGAGRTAGAGTTTSAAQATMRTAGVALSHIGMVRFDAFEDAGGAQSFALALIDDDGDGIVLTSLHSRSATRLYLKGVRRGVSDLPLSAEEMRALTNAGIVPGA